MVCGNHETETAKCRCEKQVFRLTILDYNGGISIDNKLIYLSVND